jgi:hypothetical protein
MSENISIALGIICVILIVGLVGAITNYTSILNNKDNIIQNKDSQISALTNQKNQIQTWLDGNITLINQTQIWLDGNSSLLNQTRTLLDTLQFAYDNYVGTHHYTDLEYDTLKSERDALKSENEALKAPKLVTVHLMGDDERSSEQYYFHVYGYVCNVGTNTAYNSKIHVIAYQSGGVVAISTYIDLGTIDGESWTNVDSNIYYAGTALVNVTVTLEWASAP